MNASAQWFPGGRGLASGVTQAGIAVGAMLFIPLTTQFMNPNNLPPDELISSEERCSTLQYCYSTLQILILRQTILYLYVRVEMFSYTRNKA